MPKIKDPFPFIDPRPDVKVANPITEWWPAPIKFDDESEPTRNRHFAPVTNWYQRKRPETPVIDPWGSTVDNFIQYLTGTDSAPGVSLSQHCDDMPEWDAFGLDTTVTTFTEWDLDGNPLEPDFPEPHGWTVITDDSPLEVAA
ncbi:hypothetical protein AALF15_12960 [Corynebacteriaceae bacterium 7-707]